MRDTWRELCRTIAGRDHPAHEVLYHALEALYAYPARPYHTLDHVAACLRLSSEFRRNATDPVALDFALFLHDCVYIAQRSDNEARSAMIADLFLVELGANTAFRAEVRSLVMATTHKTPPSTADEQLIVDIDLAILGAPDAEYDRYATNIRAEYSFADDAAYRAGRSAFLRNMLDRPRIFHHPELASRHEAAARRNIARELQRLNAG